MMLPGGHDQLINRSILSAAAAAAEVTAGKLHSSSTPASAQYAPTISSSLVPVASLQVANDVEYRLERIYSEFAHVIILCSSAGARTHPDGSTAYPDGVGAH